MQSLPNVVSWSIWDYRDCFNCVPFSLAHSSDVSLQGVMKEKPRDILEDVRREIQNTLLVISTANSTSSIDNREEREYRYEWDMILTHGPMGEYGHLQHRELSHVVKMACRRVGQGAIDRLYYFSPQPERTLGKGQPYSVRPQKLGMFHTCHAYIHSNTHTQRCSLTTARN